jgi:hypothetical protein
VFDLQGKMGAAVRGLEKPELGGSSPQSLLLSAPKEYTCLDFPRMLG